MIKIILTFAMAFTMSACGDGRGSVHGEPLENHGEAAPVLSDGNIQQKKLLVFGGTSGIGLQTVKLALSRGHSVTSITRRPERMPMQHGNLDNRKGDITKLATFEKLLADQDAIISAIGLSPTRKEITVYSEGIKRVLEGMTLHGKRRVISVTGIGAGDSKGHGGFFYDRILNPLLLKTDYEDKNRQEKILQGSDVIWTIVRPGFLTDDPAETSYRVISDMDGVVSGDISRADVAHFLVALVEQDSYQRNTVFISN